MRGRLGIGKGRGGHDAPTAIQRAFEMVRHGGAGVELGDDIGKPNRVSYVLVVWPDYIERTMGTRAS